MVMEDMSQKVHGSTVQNSIQNPSDTHPTVECTNALWYGLQLNIIYILSLYIISLYILYI